MKDFSSLLLSSICSGALCVVLGPCHVKPTLVMC